MASTETGARLTTAYRAQQLAARARSLRGLAQLWAAVDITDLSGTIEVFAQAAGLLAAQGFDESAVGASRYFTLFREAEIGSGLAVPIASRPSPAALGSDIRGAALSGILHARRSGRSLSSASDNGLVRAIGALSKAVLSGGRATLLSGVQADRRALGWMRATSGDPCPFCRMLAGRGANYRSERSADFQSHDDCACTPEPYYSDSGLAGVALQNERYRAEYDGAQRWARENGSYSQGTSNDELNNYRRWLAAGEPEPSAN